MNAEPVSAPDAIDSAGAPMRDEGRPSGRRDEQFEEFVAHVGPYLLRVALLLSGDRNHAEDLVQTTFERTYRSWGRAVSTDPRAYARKVLVNLRIDRWRGGTHREVLTSLDTLPLRTLPSHADTVDERNEVVRTPTPRACRPHRSTRAPSPPARARRCTADGCATPSWP